MISLEAYDEFCASLPATHKVVQWGGASVWKVGEKVFAVGGWSNADAFAVTFKCTPQSYEILKEQAGLRPAPYLASRGMKWIQNFEKPGLTDKELRDHIKASHKIVAMGLSKKKRRELGLYADEL